MKTLGVVGGLGPEATLDYYRLIVDGYRERVHDGSYPEFLINSVNIQKYLDAVTAGELDKIAAWLLAAIDQLARAGADFCLIAANTPHIVFDEVQARSPLPLLSIVDSACDSAKARGVKRVALFGTRFTMRADFYPKGFQRAELELVLPADDELEWVHDKYVNELIKGIVLPESREGLLAIVESLKEREGAEAVLLAGTELPLILRMEEHEGVLLLDTAKIHVERALDEMLEAR